MTQYVLPDLPYDYGALEPHVSGAIMQLHDHQSQVTQGSVPLLVLDAWEHAYYLQYKNEKAKFFDAIWNVWNWTDVASRLEAAQKLDLKLTRTVSA